jgi:hypothetical protein
MAGNPPDERVFPSLLKRVRDHVAGHAYITGFSVNRVAPNLNGFEDGMRWVIVSPAPGSRSIRRLLDARTMTFNCYAEDYDTTRELAERALAAVLSMRGKYVDLVVTTVEVSITPYDLTDQLDGKYRFVFDVVVYFRPS